MKIYDNGIYRNMTEEEEKAYKEDNTIENETTEFDKLEAQVTYTAMMTDTLLTNEV